MKRNLLLAVVSAGIVAVAAVAAAVGGPGPSAVTASSHREAPLISEDPSADNTDLYAFRSPDKPSTVTIVSNWIPGEDPAAGPNYYTFSPSAKYKLNIDQEALRAREDAAEQDRSPLDAELSGARPEVDRHEGRRLDLRRPA